MVVATTVCSLAHMRVPVQGAVKIAIKHTFICYTNTKS